MTAKKVTVENIVYTTFSVPLSELLDAYVPAEERHKPGCTWWANSTGELDNHVHFVRSERTEVNYDAEGRELLEARERNNTQ